MTLTTTIYVRGQVEPRRAVGALRELLGAAAVPLRVHEGNGQVDMDHPAGMGLSAWMLTRWGIHRQPLLEQPELLPEDPNEKKGIPPAYGEVTLDTAYGAPGGAGRIHAQLVREFGAWLTAQGIPWSWSVDTHGDLHDGLDGLDDLEGGQRAAA